MSIWDTAHRKHLEKGEAWMNLSSVAIEADQLFICLFTANLARELLGIAVYLTKLLQTPVRSEAKNSYFIEKKPEV